MALVCLLALFLGLMLLPYLYRLAISLWSSLFQIYTFSILTFYPSLTLLSTVSLAPLLFKHKTLLYHPPLIFLILLMSIQGLSLIWSSDIHFGIATLIPELLFIILYVASFNLMQVDPKKIIFLFKIVGILSIIPIIMVIYFSLHHEANIAFLKHPLIIYFINPKTLSVFFSDPGHHAWNGKPIFFLINPNVGAAYLGITALLLFGIGFYAKSKWLQIIGLLSWVSIFFIFSTAASILAIFIPLCLLSIGFIHKQKYLWGIKTTVWFTLIWGGLSVIIALILFTHPETSTYLTRKLASRFLLWTPAITNFHDHILMGLGFGGWIQEYEKYRQYFPLSTLTPGFPPHNTLVYLWSQSGIFAPLFFILFIISCLYYCWQAFCFFKQAGEKHLALCIGGAIMWITLQGMGENWGAVGTIHMQPLLAIPLGWIMAGYVKKNGATIK